jgi:hypothetical protein
MRAGGRIILLDDYGTGDELLERYGIRRVPQPAHPPAKNRDNPARAHADPASSHPVVRDIAHVVTNHATGLSHPNLSRLLVVRAAPEQTHGEDDVFLALAGSVGRGRLLAVGDGSVAINAMMRYPGNRTLASALVRYATEDDAWGTREGKLYIVTNDFETSGSFGGGLGGDAGAAGLLGLFRRAHRHFREALESLRHDGLPPFPAYLLAIGGGLGIVVWVSARAGKTHRPTPPRYVKPVPASDQGGIAGRAALLGASGSSRVLAMVELKSALEEDLAMRLGLDRVPSREELVVSAHNRGMFDDKRARELSELLEALGKMEMLLELRRRGVADRVRDTHVLAMSARIRALLDAARAPLAASEAPRRRTEEPVVQSTRSRS